MVKQMELYKQNAMYHASAGQHTANIASSAIQKPIRLLEYVLLIVFAYYSIIPISHRQLSWPVMLILAAGYTFYYITYTGCTNSETKTILLYVGLICFISLCYFFLTDTVTITADSSNYGLKRFLSKINQMTYVFFPILIWKRIHAVATKTMKMVFLLFCTSFVVYTIITTLSALEIDPRVARRNILMTDENIGSFSFVCAIGILVPACYALSLIVSSRIEKLLFLGTAVFLAYFIIKAQYTLALLIALIAVLLVTVREAGPIKRIVCVFISPFLLVGLFLLIYRIASEAGSTDVLIRLNEVKDAVTGNDVGRNLGGRTNLYSDTIKAFFHSPIIGNRRLEIDGHATFLTVLADIGLFGGIPFYYMYFSSRKRITATIKNYKIKNIYTIVFMAYIAMGYVNPIHSNPALSFSLFLIVPLMLEVIPEFRVSSCLRHIKIR